VLMTCLRRRLRGGKRKGADGIGDFFSRRDGQQGREGGSGAESTWKRETDRERGASVAVGGRHRHVADGRGRPACAAGVARDWRRNRGWRGLTSGPPLQSWVVAV
jgi:hypothetical protein